MNNSSIWLFLIVIGLIILLFFLYRKTKKLKLDSVYFISGGVKTGKSFLSVALAVKNYKKRLFLWYLLKPFAFVFKKTKRFGNYDSEKPMLYSNIPLRYIRYNRFTIDILERKVRIPNKSVVLIDEVSLLADSMLFKDKIINDELMLFLKLFGHYTHGGLCIINSQTISDCHYSIKRCMSKYLYISSRKKFPFISTFSVREMIYSDDNNSVNVNNTDLEDSTLTLWFLNKYYKYYDCYCYSIFTDSLGYQVDYKSHINNKRDSLKCDCLVSLQDFKTLDRRGYINEKK